MVAGIKINKKEGQSLKGTVPPSYLKIKAALCLE